MATISMRNEDGSPFYANLHAPSTVTITISEAYSLVDSLKSTLAFNRDLLSGGTLPADLAVTFERISRDLQSRIDDIETVIDHDKYEQWAKVAPAWAIRAGAR